MDGNTRVVCIREVQKSLDQSVKLLIEDKIAALEVGNYFRILNTHIETTNGSGIIIFQGMQNHTAESIKSLEGYDIAWCEEAQSISQRSLGLLYPTIRKSGSQIWFSWNPTSPKDPVDRFFTENKNDPRFISIKTTYRDNPWFAKSESPLDMERDRQRDPQKYAHVWLGEYQNKSEARVFSNWREQAFETPQDARFYFGADWGFSVDPTVLVRCWIKDRSLFVDYEAWQVGCEIDKCPALFGTIPGANRWPIIADSADPQNISYLSRHGFPNIKPSVKGTNSIEQGVEFLKSYDIIVHPRCTHVIDELASYSYEIDKQTEEVLPRLADEKNHTIDSLRYAVEAIRRAPVQPVFGVYTYGNE
jgi:phage terminase large subunit